MEVHIHSKYHNKRWNATSFKQKKERKNDQKKKLDRGYIEILR